MKQPDETHLAGGMADGTLSIRRRQYKPEEVDVTFNSTNFISHETTKTNGIEHKPAWDKDELRIESRRMKRLKEYDKLLKAFKYSAALDSVLRKVSFVLQISTFCFNAFFSKFHQRYRFRLFMNSSIEMG